MMLNEDEPEVLRTPEPLDGHWLRLVHLHLAWFAALPAFPAVAMQGRTVRRGIPRLPDAEGATRGLVKDPDSDQEPLRIVTLGESTVSGVGVATHETGLTGSIAHSLQRRLRRSVEWRAIGKNGATAHAVNRTLMPMLQETQLDAVIVALGANDTFRLTSVRAWKAEITQIVDSLIAQRTKHVFFSQVPPVGSFPAFPRAFRRVLGARADVLGIELVRLLRKKPGVHFCPIRFTHGRMASDGVHPSEAGYAAWGEQLAECMAQRLAGDTLV